MPGVKAVKCSLEDLLSAVNLLTRRQKSVVANAIDLKKVRALLERIEKEGLPEY